MVRGPAWQWEDQDGGIGSMGTLTQNENEGWWRVKWKGEWWQANSYRVGESACLCVRLCEIVCVCVCVFVSESESESESDIKRCQMFCC